MGGTNWHVPTVAVDASDPFDPSPQTQREGPVAATTGPSQESSLVTYEGIPDGDRAFAELRSLARAEGLTGKVCALKDRDWSNPTCSTCSERGSRGVLCGIGVAQERALAEFMDSPDVA